MNSLDLKSDLAPLKRRMITDNKTPAATPESGATRKEPVPPSLAGSFPELAAPSDRVEPKLGPIGSAELKVEPLAVPADWRRRTERHRGAIEKFMVPAVTALCVCVGGGIAVAYIASTPWNTSSPIAVGQTTAPSAAAVPIAQTQPAQSGPAKPAAQHPIAAAQAAETARRDALAQARKAEAAHARRAAAEHARRVAEQARRAELGRKAAAEKARKAAVEQARQAQAEQARKAAAEQARQAQVEQARQAAADQARQAAAEQARLAAVQRQQDKLRVAHRREEAAQRTARLRQAKTPTRDQAEQAVQDQLDRAGQTAPGGRNHAPRPAERPEQNAKLQPQSLPGEGPPLDAGDLPPPAQTAPAEIH
jgi:hypothetical protein